MTLLNGNIFRLTGPLWGWGGGGVGVGGFTGHWWIPITEASDAELWFFSLICAWINRWVNNRKAGDLRRYRAHYDVIVMRFVELGISCCDTLMQTILPLIHASVSCQCQFNWLRSICKWLVSNGQHSLSYYSDVTMGAMASQITGVSIVYSTVCSGADQRKHQNSASLAFVRGIHRLPVNSLHKGPVTRKMFPFDDVIMLTVGLSSQLVIH